MGIPVGVFWAVHLAPMTNEETEAQIREVQAKATL